MPFFIVDARARTGAAPGDIRDEDIRGATRDGSRETRGASPVDSRAREGEFGGPRAARTAPGAAVLVEGPRKSLRGSGEGVSNHRR